MNSITAIRNGDRFVFQQVFNQYHEKLYFFVFSKTRSAFLAEETVQITFIKLWNYRESLNEAFTISTQIYRIASTTLIDLLRQQNNSAVFIKELEQQGAGSFSNNTTERIETGEIQTVLSQTLESMPPVRKRVFEMSRIEGLSHNEIAAILLISKKTVEGHITKALKQLKESLPAVLLLFFKILILFSVLRQG
ncbi:sigma-70 family RNA polymerase sigma factor [Niabella yanshanensis]|uniref:Sigma-70 family RNA polymerase sigma factor n=1 Tax=Niabella yanshanensis TaxID=577386 RepID=A0ABZ0W5J3_9BACT|nr:sigma-70 family RNA polymerase sigma factor [Niabella yanshanensis]WQD37814.1 sigma-70 family RNA polymerase sigma factor [Niabella yanshanensis]